MTEVQKAALESYNKIKAERGEVTALDMFIAGRDWFKDQMMKDASEDLEKFTERINTFQARYKHPEIISIKGAIAFMARMFYQYPNVAREWYESLPKATMD